MGLLEFLIIIILVLWVLGFAFQILGGFIHVLLILALILFIYRLIRGSRS
jgi:hypothetical protein